MRSCHLVFRVILSWVFTACLSHTLTAQSPVITTTLTGRITDAQTGQPLPFAAVFINATTKGTTTNANGQYQLRNVPLGTVELVVSYLGYETVKKTLRFETVPPHTVNLALASNGLTLAGVTVKAKKDKNWEHQFRIFERELLGDTPFANQCTIKNGHVVRFEEQSKQLKAVASEPLVIENKALGYRIIYDMQFFTYKAPRMDYAGPSRFEELVPDNDREKRRWERNRNEAYLGSQRHLMASLAAGTTEQEGFLVYRINRKQRMTTYFTDVDKRLLPITNHPIVQPGRLAFERQVVLREPICVFYTRISSRNSPYRDMPYPYSEIELPVGGYTFIEITTDGRITKPNGMLTTGYQSRDRLSTLLPQDWSLAGQDSATSQPALTNGLLLAPDRRLDSLKRAWMTNHPYVSPVLFVQNDKAFYPTGDRVWLSGFLLDAATHKLLAGDDAIHLDLLAPNGKPVWHRWARVSNGRFSDSFRLSDTLATGTYRLRAYTDADRYAKQPAFERFIAVYNAIEESTDAEIPAAKKKNKQVDRPTPIINTNTASKLDVQFLPEGGRWVVNLPARLGIKSIDENGIGKQVSGRIVDTQGKEVSRFTTNQLGIGSIVLTPKPNQLYQALIDNQQLTVALPPVDADGLSLMVDALSNPASIAVHLAGSPKFSQQVVYVLAQSRGVLYYQQKVQLVQGKADLTLQAAMLPAGVAHIMLLDNVGHPQAERLLFIHEGKQAIKATLSPNKKLYTPHEQVSINVQLTDSLGEHVLGFMSMAVTDVSQLPDDTLTTNIRAHLLLGSELRGHVEKPNTYFIENKTVTRQALDNLLLTQGWRRLSWQKAATLEQADTLAGMTIAGQLIDDKNNPIPYGELLLTSLGKPTLTSRSVGADVDGRFRLGGLFVADTVRLTTQVMDTRLKAIKGFVVTDNPTDWFSVNTQPPSFINWNSLQTYISAAHLRQDSDATIYRDPKVKQLKEVVIKATSLDSRPEHVKRRSLHGKPDNVVLFDDKSPRYSNLYDMLIGRVPGVLVVRKQPPSPGYEVTIRGLNSYQSSTQPLYLIDGTPIEDPSGDRLLAFNPADIERIEVLKGSSSAMYGSRGGNGVIAFYTRQGKYDSELGAASKGLGQLTFVGFPSVQREFYIPRYEAAPEANAPIDRRDVLYWKPVMQTDSQGKSVVAFPLSDVARSIRIVLQGITSDGRPISEVREIKVQ